MKTSPKNLGKSDMMADTTRREIEALLHKERERYAMECDFDMNPNAQDEG